LQVKDDDLVAGTHGRGFWILDDITPLRQITDSVADANAFLFSPQVATRVRWDMNTDTPLPPDEPAGENPPDGAIIDYYIKSAGTSPVTLEIFDAANKLVRRYSSADPVPQIDRMLEIPKYWVRPPQVLPDDAGMHRFLWDLHYSPTPGLKPLYPMQAVVHDTAPAPSSPWVMPGQYTVKLTAGGKSYTRSFSVRMDPRVKTPNAGLMEQFTESMKLYEDAVAASKAIEQLGAIRGQLDSLKKRAGEGAAADAITATDQKAAALKGEGNQLTLFFGRATGPDTLSSVRGTLLALMSMMQGSDVAPPTQIVEAASERRQKMAELMSQWKTFKEQDLPKLNATLKGANLSVVTIGPLPPAEQK
jgi:hypothetical protein